ncbi:uncharacterized protein G2W53_019106 [Senna tora]|uniref:Uncharacterized protein n=1 Tax=Senna tora TaxID=362788 RepID=A0A834TTL3_9FABA|nr:uncharacterized protein G2W53_019106 [Senna tora]
MEVELEVPITMDQNKEIDEKG